MPNQYKCNEPVQAYRNYYKQEKKDFATWKLDKPIWWEQ